MKHDSKENKIRIEMHPIHKKISSISFEQKVKLIKSIFTLPN